MKACVNLFLRAKSVRQAAVMIYLVGMLINGMVGSTPGGLSSTPNPNGPGTTYVEHLQNKIAVLERRVEMQSQTGEKNGGVEAWAANAELFRKNNELNQELIGARRARIVLPGLAAAGVLGSASDLNQEFGNVINEQFIRPGVIDQAAELSMKRSFPGARSTASIDLAVWKALSARGFTKSNTLFATSVCPDEVNFADGEITELLKTRWGESFSLGGLAGVPFVGPAGFSAFAHHAPEYGKLFIMFAPHVGIDDGGNIGSLHRENQRGTSTACGAAIGTLAQLDKISMAEEAKLNRNDGQNVDTSMISSFTDAQLELLVRELGKRMPTDFPKGPNAPNRVACECAQESTHDASVPCLDHEANLRLMPAHPSVGRCYV